MQLNKIIKIRKLVNLIILGSKIFLGLLALEGRYAACKGYGITMCFEPACRVHNFFICC